MTSLAAQPARTTPARARAGLPELAGDLEVLLGEYLAEYRALITVNAAHLAAIGAADRRAIDVCATDQHRSASRLAVLEARRAAIVRAATSLLRAPGKPGGEVTTSTIAAACAEPQRVRLSALARDVRLAAERASEQHRTLSLASRTLMAHMQSLMEQVGRALSHAGTYARPGMVASVLGAGTGYAPQVCSTLDLTS
ncbi:MAG: hypothetical protein AB7K52_01060 [Phycisphaerales bacterium]